MWFFEIAKNPDLNRAEYLCEWRADISSFVLPEIIDSSIIKGRSVLAPSGEKYSAFIDVSGGVHDSHTCSSAYRDENDVAVLACAREIKSSDTESIVQEFAALLKSYKVNTANADRYGAEWVKNAFERHGIRLVKSPFDRSTIYLNALPALNAGQVRLLDLPRLRSQLLALERRTIRGSGRDVVDHPSGGADDLCNSALGALVMASRPRRQMILMGVGPNDSIDSPAINYAELYREQAELRAAVWADGLDVPIAASILPSARVTPVDGGYRISGQFPFASGINHSRWVIVGGMDESGGYPEWTFFLLGPNDFKVLDTWFTGAMRATGSNTVIFDDVFVLKTHTIRLSDLRDGKGPGGKLHAHPIYRAPFISYAPLTFVTPMLGAALGAYEIFRDWTKSRRGTGGVAIAEIASIQVRLGRAAADLDVAELLAPRGGNGANTVSALVGLARADDA